MRKHGCGARQESAQVTDPAQVDQLCDEAVDVAGFIRDHVVQAELNERGNYGVSHDPLLCTAPGDSDAAVCSDTQPVCSYK